MSSQLGHIVKTNWSSRDEATTNGQDFSFLNLDDRIIAGLSSAGYINPRPIQLKAFPLCRTGRDVFIQGEPEAGKTLVFSILALTAVLEDENLDVLIIAPAREGAFEIYNTICDIGSKVVDLRCECFIGGIHYSEDIPKAFGCKIAVGTPGRLLHLIEDDKLRINNTRLFIIDDFDDISTTPEIRYIFDLLPEEKQTVVTSLIYSSDIMELASKYLKPEFLTLCNENEPSLLGMAHYYYIVPMDSLLRRLSYRRKLEILKKILFKVKFSQCLVFCRSVKWVEPLCIDIKAWGINAVSTSNEKNQLDRLQVAQAMKKNKYKVLVSTDVSSRGLDTHNVDLVINFDLPYSCRVYLSRCGRAGRFGAKCSSITFVLKDETQQFKKLDKEGRFNSYTLPKPIPEDLHCDISTSRVSSIQYILKTGYNSKENLVPSTDLNKYKTVNLEKAATRESSPLIANKMEEQTADIETADTIHLVEDLGVTRVENKCAEDDPRLIEGLEMMRIEDKCAEDTPKIKGTEVGFLPSFEQTAVLPGSLDVCSASETVPKSIFELPSTSKLSGKYRMKLEKGKNCSKKVNEIPQVIGRKKKSYRNIKNPCNKKSVKSHNLSKSQSNSECHPNQSESKFYSGYRANHRDRKKVAKSCKMHSSHGKNLDRCDSLSEAGDFNVQRNVETCHASFQHCCHCPNIYCQPPFMVQREIFYNQLLFINNFAHFLSHVM